MQTTIMGYIGLEFQGVYWGYIRGSYWDTGNKKESTI